MTRRRAILVPDALLGSFLSVYGCFALICLILVKKFHVDLNSEAARQPFGILIFIAVLIMIAYGFERIKIRHPLTNSSYLTWLRSTPWTPHQPLPLGPLHLVWQDFLIMIFTAACVGWTGLLDPIIPSFAMVLVFSIMLLLAFPPRDARAPRPFPWRGYLAFLLLPIPAIWWLNDWAMCLTALGVYLLSEDKLRISLRAVPWVPKPELPIPKLDFPWNRIGPAAPDIKRPIPISSAFLYSVGFAWWIFAITHTILVTFRQPEDAGAMAAIVFGFGCFSSLGRWLLYIANRGVPISGLGRLFTGRLIIPAYDRVLIAPLCIFLITCFFAIILTLPNKPSDLSNRIIFPVAMGTILFALLSIGPTLRNWILTGGYRIPMPPRRQHPRARLQTRSLNHS